MCAFFVFRSNIYNKTAARPGFTLLRYDWEAKEWFATFRLAKDADAVVGLQTNGMAFLSNGGAIWFLNRADPTQRNDYSGFGVRMDHAPRGFYSAFNAKAVAVSDDSTVFFRGDDHNSYLVDGARGHRLPATTMTGFAASALKDGRVLVTGGYNRKGKLSAYTEVFTLADASKRPVRRMQKQRRRHQQITLGNGEVFVVGGCEKAEGELYSPATDTWALVGVDYYVKSSDTARHYTYLWASDDKGLVAIDARKKVFPVAIEQWWTPSTHKDLRKQIRRRASILCLCMMRAENEAYAIMLLEALWRLKFRVEKKSSS